MAKDTENPVHEEHTVNAKRSKNQRKRNDMPTDCPMVHKDVRILTVRTKVID